MSRGGAQHDGAGYGTMVAAFRFLRWADAQKGFPMPEAVMARFNCSKATANRWLNALEDFRGEERPRRDWTGQVRRVA